MNVAFFLLLVASGLIFYIVAGYPLLLASRRSPVRPPIGKDFSFEPTVSVIVAVHNGGAVVRRKLETLFALDYPRHLIDITVVSDGSTDETEEIVREYSDRGVRLLVAPRGGKSAAVNLGLSCATGEIIFFTDIRQPLDPQSLRHLVANFADQTVGAVTGELRLLSGDQGEQADMDLYWRYEVWARKRHTEIDSLFNTTGCIYAIRRSLAAPLPPDTLTDDAVMPLRAFFRGYRVIFDAEAIAYDYPALAGTEFWRRFRTLAGLWQVYARMPELFTSKDRMRFHFLSHKFSRLMLPWAMLLFLFSTLALPHSPFRTGLLYLGAAWLLLAFLNEFVPAGSTVKRLTSPAGTLLIMNVASFASVAVFFVPATSLWTQTRVRVEPPVTSKAR